MSMLLMFLDLANTSSPPPRHPLPTVSFLFPRIFSSHHYIRPAFSGPFITDQLPINDFSFYHESLNRMIIWRGTTRRTSVQPQEDLSTQRNLLQRYQSSSWMSLSSKIQISFCSFRQSCIFRLKDINLWQTDRLILIPACLKCHQFLVSCLSPRKSNICFSSYMT